MEEEEEEEVKKVNKKIWKNGSHINQLNAQIAHFTDYK